VIVWRKAFGLGLLAWLLPFIVAFLAFPLHEPSRAVFESIMAVTVAATAVLLGLLYFRGRQFRSSLEGLSVGVVWLVVCVAIDAPLMLLGGPMQMSLNEYLGDIGLTYVLIPIVTWGLGTIGSGERSSR